MVKTKEKDGKTYYLCENCGFAYKDRKTAKKCQDWCDSHNSCSIEITRNAVKI